MNHAAFVGRGNGRAELTRDLHRLVVRQPSDTPEQRRQRFPVDVLHREEAIAAGLTEVVEPADVLVRDLARDAKLVVELTELRLLIRAGGRNFRATG